MIKAYNEPEFKVVKMANEDVLTTSTLDLINSGWESGKNNGETVPVINL
jgi:hypothetical protein